MENGCDGYHVSTVHWNYAATMDRRKVDGTKAVDANSWSKSVAGVYGFDHGHILLWTKTMNPEVRPVYQYREEIKARVGEVQADFIVNQTRNLCLYPNVFLMDQFSTQIRVVRPLSVNQTEVTIFCFAPKGENAADRATRIRQYEDFFNVTGMGTADDLEEFRACQTAMPALPRCGTTCRAVLRCGSMARTRMRRAWVSSRLSQGSAAKTKACLYASTNTGCT